MRRIGLVGGCQESGLSEAPLIRSGLVFVEEPDRPFLSRSLRVPDRVAAYLLGDDRPDPLVTPLIRQDAVNRAEGIAAALGSVLAGGIRLVYLRERAGGSGPRSAAAGLAAGGYGVLSIDLDHLNPSAELETVVRAIGREALLSSAAVVAGPVEAVFDRDATAVRALAALPGPVVLYGRATWEPGWSRAVPLVVDIEVTSSAARRDQWERSLGPDAPAGLGDADVATQFLLSGRTGGPGSRAARLRRGWPAIEVSRRTTSAAGARAQNAAGLERLARRIEPRSSWDDLVLAPATAPALRGAGGAGPAPRPGARRLADAPRRRTRAAASRRCSPATPGPARPCRPRSIAADLGLDLYTVNLATVVDKYVGETEKNLERIFAEAGGVNAVLFFDEADAIFGKRSEVRDAHDRYANIESAYLLQRMETFDGLAVLATNLRANIDEAFTRRLDAIVDFPAPDAESAAGAVGPLPRRPVLPRGRGPGPRLLRPGVRAVGRQHPRHCDHRRLSRRGQRPAGGHGGPHPRCPPGVPQTRPDGRRL